MDQNRLLMEAELKALMEVSQDFARGLGTVAARMKVLKSCLDKQHDGRVSRVDRATSPIVFRTDRSTSVSPHRFKSPVKIKREKVDIHDANEIVTNLPEERNNCDITITQTQSISVNSFKENRIDFPQKRKLVGQKEQLMEDSHDVSSPGDVSGASTSATSQVLTMPLDSSLSNLRKSYYVVNPINGLAIPIDVSQINELGLANNPVQQVTLQHNQPIEEDILYAMQKKHEHISINDAHSTVATVGTAEQEIFLSSGEESELVISDKVFAAKLPPLIRNRGAKKKTTEEIREYNRLRQVRYRANQQRRLKESIERDKQKVSHAANNLNIILNSNVKKDETNLVNRKVLILRKDLIKKTYTRGNRQLELKVNGITAARQTETT